MNLKYLATGLLVTASAFAADAVPTATLPWTGQTLHLYNVVPGLSSDSSNIQNICSPPGVELYVSADDGTMLTVSVSSDGNLKFPLPSECAGGYARRGLLYAVPKNNLLGERYATRSWVGGILAVPFKFHLSDHSLSVGSTVGGYIGYRTTFFNAFTITPIVGGGLAMISTSPLGSTGNTQTSAGLSAATGLIGSVGSDPSHGMQWGIVIGVDYLDSGAGYRYEGKPWLAAEIGYNFGL